MEIDMIDVSNLPELIGILIMGLQLLLIMVTSIKIYQIIRKRNELKKITKVFQECILFLYGLYAFFTIAELFQPYYL